MHLGGKTRAKKDHLSPLQRKSIGQLGRAVYALNEGTMTAFDIDVSKDFADATPDEGDLLLSGAFNQKLRFDY